MSGLFDKILDEDEDIREPTDDELDTLEVFDTWREEELPDLTDEDLDGFHIETVFEGEEEDAIE